MNAQRETELVFEYAGRVTQALITGIFNRLPDVTERQGRKCTEIMHIIENYALECAQGLVKKLKDAGY